MSISISDIIKVSIAVAPNAVATDGFGPLLFMSKKFVPVMGEKYPVRSYTSLKEVSADFPTGEINKAATAWYSQKPTPKTFLVGALVNETVTPSTPGTLTATVIAVLADIKALVDGVVSVNINGAIKATAPINFSGNADLDAVTSTLNAAFSAANMGVQATQTAGKFKLATTKTGSNVTVSDATGTASVALKLTAANNPQTFAGADEQSISMDLAKIANTPFNFFYVGLDRKYRGKVTPIDNQMMVAKWCEASGKVFGWGDSDVKILVSGSDNSFKRAKNQNLRNTICVFDASTNFDEYPEVAIMARAATVNFNVANSVLNLAFKKGPGISTADLSSGQVTALQSVNGNAFINVDDNVMFWNGKMADGTWFDTVQGVEWLTQKIRNNVFNLFYQSTTKIPWTETGVALVNQQVTLALELAKTNGLIAPGYDNEGTFYPDGYKVFSTDLSLLQSQKGDRIWQGTSFIAIGSGALQGAEINGNFVQ